VTARTILAAALGGLDLAVARLRALPGRVVAAVRVAQLAAAMAGPRERPTDPFGITVDLSDLDIDERDLFRQLAASQGQRYPVRHLLVERDGAPALACGTRLARAILDGDTQTESWSRYQSALHPCPACGAAQASAEKPS
jgi:hypothetical protein